MEVKQILIAFWWLIALLAITTSFYRIDSFKLEKDPEDVAVDIALIINRLGTLDYNGKITYLLEDGNEARLSDGFVEIYRGDVKIASYLFIDKGNVVLERIEDGVLIVKNG